MIRDALLILAGLMAIAPAAIACDGNTITGEAYVKDGDTIRIGKQSIRLWGIDAPEKNQTCTREGETVDCGREAAAALKSFLAGQVLTCERQPGNDKYGRMIARCTTPAGADIGAFMVDQGQALAYRRYSTDYVANEVKAHAARKGLWAESFVEPWDWRHEKKH